MFFNGSDGNKELRSDLSVGNVFLDHQQNFFFPFREQLRFEKDFLCLQVRFSTMLNVADFIPDGGNDADKGCHVEIKLLAENTPVENVLDQIKYKYEYY